jgi:hypothetical protein
MMLALLATDSSEVAASPTAHAFGDTYGETATACQAVLHMDRQFCISAAHRAHGNVTTHTTPQATVELAVNERIEVAAVAEMIEVHHTCGNPTMPQMLPTE